MVNNNTKIKDYKIIMKVFSHYDCEACVVSKRNKQARQLGSQVPVLVMGSHLSCDWDPVAEKSSRFNVPAIGGFIGYFLFVCEATAFYIAYLSKSQTEFLWHLDETVLFFKRYGYTVRQIRFDSGSTENSTKVIEYLSKNHIIPEPASVDSLYQNVSERHIQHVDKGITTLLAASPLLDQSFWGLALLSFVFTSNLCPNTLTIDVSQMVYTYR